MKGYKYRRSVLLRPAHENAVAVLCAELFDHSCIVIFHNINQQNETAMRNKA